MHREDCRWRPSSHGVSDASRPASKWQCRHLVTHDGEYHLRGWKFLRAAPLHWHSTMHGTRVPHTCSIHQLRELHGRRRRWTFLLRCFLLLGVSVPNKPNPTQHLFFLTRHLPPNIKGWEWRLRIYMPTYVNTHIQYRTIMCLGHQGVPGSADPLL